MSALVLTKTVCQSFVLASLKHKCLVWENEKHICFDSHKNWPHLPLQTLLIQPKPCVFPRPNKSAAPWDSLTKRSFHSRRNCQEGSEARAPLWTSICPYRNLWVTDVFSLDLTVGGHFSPVIYCDGTNSDLDKQRLDWEYSVMQQDESNSRNILPHTRKHI